MKKIIVLLILLAGVELWAQDKSQVTVKSSEVNNGVVILAVQEGKARFELQCNKGSADCRIVEAGNYLMVRLPKNWGMYDCANVDLYPTAGDSKSSQKIGEYCLIEQK